MLLDVAGRALTRAWRRAARFRGPLAGIQALPATAHSSLKHQGYAIIPNWLAHCDVRQVLGDSLALEAAEQGHTAGVGGVVGSESEGWHIDQEFRRTSLVWIHEPPESFHGQLAARLALISTMEGLCLQLAHHGSLPLNEEATSIAYLYYPAGGFYRRHVDAPPTPSPTGEHREVSFLLYLDSGWREEWGGALRIFPEQPDGKGAEPHIDVLPESGTLVLLRSPRIEHEVLETLRPRRCVVGWFCSTDEELPNAAMR